MQATWYGDKALPNTFYGKSENCEAWKNIYVGSVEKTSLLHTYNLNIWTIALLPQGKLPPSYSCGLGQG